MNLTTHPPPAREYRVIVIEDGAARPLAGLRTATSVEEAETMLFHLRAVMPFDQFDYEHS